MSDPVVIVYKNEIVVQICTGKYIFKRVGDAKNALRYHLTRKMVSGNHNAHSETKQWVDRLLADLLTSGDIKFVPLSMCGDIPLSALNI